MWLARYIDTVLFVNKGANRGNLAKCKICTLSIISNVFLLTDAGHCSTLHINQGVCYAKRYVCLVWATIF